MQKNRIVIFSSIVIIISSLFFSVSPSVANAASNKQGILPAVIDQINEPPANFNPLKATSQELEKYGFPKKPTDVKALQEWENAMEHAKYYVKPEQKASTAVHGTAYSSN